MDCIVRDLSELLSIDICEGAEWNDDEIYHTTEMSQVGGRWLAAL